MRSIFFIIQFFFAITAMAHPGIGIVKDSQGNIYYTDLKYVWKVTKEGDKTIVVRDVHTHELYMDANNNLYGEHLWYNGEAANTWGHYIWRLNSNGSFEILIPSTEGFPTNYGFTRDGAGNMYWVERFKETRFMKKTPKGEILQVASGKFKFIGWIHATKDGTVYFTEDNQLKKLTPDGKVILLTADLQSRTTGFTASGRNYDGYGIWTDKNENIYIAMLSAKKVQRVSPSGKVETVLTSNSMWTPCSGLFDDEGNLWLMEFSMSNETRVRKIGKDEMGTGFSSKSWSGRNHFFVTIGVAVSIMLLVLVVRFYMKSIQKKQQFLLA